MPTQVRIDTTGGRIIKALNYRMDPSMPAKPSTANDAWGGTYHLHGPNGWIDVPANTVQRIRLASGAQT